MKPSVALIGPGRVGCAIGKRLFNAGYPLATIISRSKQRATEACAYIGCSAELASDRLTSIATAEIILLAVPDDQIQQTALKIQTSVKLTNQNTMIHFSGLHPADIMRHPSSPIFLLSLHPLLPFADRQQAYTHLQQCPCALESDNPQTISLGQQLVTAIGGNPFALDSDKKVLYHAAACIASNYLVTLLASARDLLVDCHIESSRVIPLLLPLVQASLDNVEKLGPEQGLTGPIVRGDTGTVVQHVQALKDNAPELLQLYLQIGKLTASLSKKSGRIDAEDSREMQQFFSAEINQLTGMNEDVNLSEKNN